MKLYRVLSLSAALTLLRMVGSFVTAKVVAVYAGPAGLAQIGQLQGLLGALSGVVSAPLGNAVVTQTARFPESPEGRQPYWRAAVAVFATLFLVFAGLVLAKADFLAAFLVQDGARAWLIVLLVALLPLYAAHALFLSVLNGLQRYQQYVLPAVVSTVLSVALTVFAAANYGTDGALFAAVTSGALYGLCLGIRLWREPWMQWKSWVGHFEREHLVVIARFFAMAMVSALVVPLSQVMVRDIIVKEVSWEAAGQWQAVWKISELYLGVAISALSVYFLPRLASAVSHEAMSAEINTVARSVLPLCVLAAGAVFLFRDLIITVLFTPAFAPARDLFLVQLIGDVVKIAAWLWAYPLVARSIAVPYVILEVVFATLLVLFAAWLVPSYGSEGANMAYLLHYALYLLVVFVMFRFRLGYGAAGG